jgi:hypothetical protein
VSACIHVRKVCAHGTCVCVCGGGVSGVRTGACSLALKSLFACSLSVPTSVGSSAKLAVAAALSLAFRVTSFVAAGVADVADPEAASATTGATAAGGEALVVARCGGRVQAEVTMRQMNLPQKTRRPTGKMYRRAVLVLHTHTPAQVKDVALAKTTESSNYGGGGQMRNCSSGREWATAGCWRRMLAIVVCAFHLCVL